MNNNISGYYGTFPLMGGFNRNFGWNVERESANWSYSPMYYMICKAFRAKVVVEFGCEHGFSTYYMAHAVKENDGLLVVVEIHAGHARAIKDGLDELGVRNIVINGDSRKVTGAPWGDCIDFALLDGCHHGDWIEYEFDLIYPRLRGRGGYVAIHDIDSLSADGFLRIIDNKAYNIEYVTFPYEFGLGLIKVTAGNETRKYRERMSAYAKEQNKIHYGEPEKLTYNIYNHVSPDANFNVGDPIVVKSK